MRSRPAGVLSHVSRKAYRNWDDWTADLEGGVGRKRYVLKELHLPSRYIRSGAQAYALAEPGSSLYNQGNVPRSEHVPRNYGYPDARRAYARRHQRSADR